MKNNILFIYIISSAIITIPNHSMAKEVATTAYQDQATRGIVDDIECIYKKGFFDPECWKS
ncbi:hypothetical protein BRY73_16355 [Ochrobactrum sp. P6BS-III]|uniref:hypothetical protein n=1 Tax=unclassified Ochrobactrum TaxID=239106 RepID=UPI0009933856|nr:hypothetical protein [Ochrobactrum sp. P6BSIII]OOL16040.1 hypothetical protein BRY73_16355 [Ochrobactrum sp. P6BS-III]